MHFNGGQHSFSPLQVESSRGRMTHSGLPFVCACGCHRSTRAARTERRDDNDRSPIRRSQPLTPVHPE